jgi:predicted nucleic acid-binding protein
MIYVLDSNIISYMLKSDVTVLAKYRAEESKGNDFIIPAIVFYEVQRGLLALQLKKRLHEFEKLCQKVRYAEFDKPVWQKATNIYASLRHEGILIDDADIFIAAFCINNACTLVTNNTKHFDRINELAHVNWVHQAPKVVFDRNA